MKKLFKILGIGAASLLLLSSCGEKAKEESKDGGKEKYLVVLKVQSSEFWQSMVKGIEDKADELGVEVKITSGQTEDDVEGQVTALEAEMANGYDGIAVAPLTSDNLVGAVSEANEKGILVANVDEKINLESLEAKGGSVISFVTTDNVLVGETAADLIYEKIGSGKVAIIEGKAGAASGEDRKAGAVKGFEKAGLEVIDSQPADWDRTKAYDLATNMISKHSDLKAIYCANDTMAMGAQEAVENSGKDIIVVGTDGNADAIESVESGKLYATVGQDPAKVGGRSLEILVEAVRAGQKPGDKEMIEEMIDPVIHIQK